MRRRVAGVAGAALVIALQTGIALRAQAPTDGELRRLADSYTQAWARGDAKALAILHATEAIRIGADGRVAVGRAAIQLALQESLTGPYRGTRLGVTPGQATRAGQDVYVAEGTYQIAGGMPPADAPTRWRYLQTLVRMNGRWLIAGDAVISPPRPPK